MLAASAIMVAIVSLISGCEAASSSDATRLGPVFTSEPGGLLRFPATAGARVWCAARGPGDTPLAVTWLTDDNIPLTDLPGLRRVFSNGTVEFLPSAIHRAGVDASSTIRCRASNAHGTILSRDVHVIPVWEREWEVRLVAGEVRAGGIAALQCRVSGTQARAALWYRRDEPLQLSPPSPDSRYLVAGDTLLIRDVTAADAGEYSCAVRNELTGHTRRAPPSVLTVLDGASSSAPRLASASRHLTVTSARDVTCLPCAATDYPPPHYTWYREEQGRLQPVEATASGPVWFWGGGAALCVTSAAAGVQHTTGAWLCKAYNVFGDATAQLRLEVDDDLSVSLAPNLLVGEAGSIVRLNCTVSAPGATLQWLHNGAPLPGASGTTLVLRGLARSHAGMYQCVARDGLRSAQASAEIRLGDSPPEMQYTFIEQALRSGGSVALRCVATALPPPRFVWLLDGQPLQQSLPRHRYSISEERSASAVGEVVSVLNISATQPSDGGQYTCRAHNSRGEALHSARLNIYGPPSVRQMAPVRAVAGENITVLCPYAGYPIRSIERGAVVYERCGRGGGANRAGSCAECGADAVPRTAC
ncbi:cell adhesion molecule Dscam2-like [Leptidea sinapis]|uniref:cell adhesion molecule Dscam2-like n=1 Tax=Leptidea sinapis TaxID=189913 RepID=UPI0021C279D7|nr:cell adhesion molecule Dscam2-like [Leptidea sinapis]